MKQKNLITTAVLISLFSITLIAQANRSSKSMGENGVTFDSKNHTYHQTNSMLYLSLPIEQKYQTMKSINAFESRLEKDRHSNTQF